MSKVKSKLSFAHLMFLVAGLLLVVKFFLQGGIPSPSSDLLGFIVNLFELIVIVGFYFFFAFGKVNCSSTIKALAPCILLIILYGRSSFSFPGDNAVLTYLNKIGEMAWFLIAICGFVFLFVHNKLIGSVFSWASIIYAAYAGITYTVMAIITAVNGNGFSSSQLIITLLLVVSLALIGAGSYKITKSQDW